MSFLIQRTAGRNLTLTQISAAALRIGRGANQELRSENPAVSLEHAVIESDAAGFVITDKGSITGTYVNGRPVESARLSKGDAIEIGDLRIEIQLADPSKPLFLRVVPARVTGAMSDDEDADVVTPVAAGARVVKAKKFDYVAAYRLKRPWLTKLSLTAILLIICFTIVGDYLIRPEKQTVFMPGGVSSAHSRALDRHGRAVATQCDTCHTPWKSVTSAKCMDCHPQDVHARFERKPPECYTCHAEHRGQTKLAAISDQRCFDCHSDLAAHSRVPGSMTFAQNRYDFDDIARITVFGEKTHPEFAYPPDRNQLRFNHQLHLGPKGIFNASGKREVLECTGCHVLSEAKDLPTGGGPSPSARLRMTGDPAPIDFEQHCQKCHRLTFDARYPNAEVPHGGEPGIVYGFIGTYSGDPGIATRRPDEIRRLLTARKQIAPDARSIIAAEQVIKTKCQKCHDVVRSGNRLAVTPPVIPAQWLTHARFTHTRHRTMPCLSCHGGAPESASTGDLLLPRLANCTACHGDVAPPLRRRAPAESRRHVASTCVTCHEYHLRPQRAVVASLVPVATGGLGSGGRMLQGILLAVIVILLLVVLIPVGIALFQRLRPERTTPAPAKPAGIPPTAKIVRPDLPTDKIPPRPPDLPPSAAPRPPESSLGATRAEPMPASVSAEAPSGTEVVQWNGLLHCTSGPLEGQRFIIEDGGFYIGRDPALAKVVIADSRVSKRHVRIVPRDGRVWAIDEGSTNGTFLASAPGQRITEVQLKRGDTLILGDNAATFVYQI